MIQPRAPCQNKPRRPGLPPRSRAPAAVLRLGHPFATTTTALAALLFASLAAGSAVPDAPRLLLFAASFLTMYAIGAANDLHDRALDAAAGRADKPLVAGTISPAAARCLAVLATALGLLAAAALGTASLAIAAAIRVAGFAYDRWAKGSLLSWLPHAVLIPSLPVWGFVAVGRFRPALLLTYPIGALLALALNIANTLPDLERDRAQGLRGLTHRLGRGPALRLCWLAIGASILLAAMSPSLTGAAPARLAPGLATATLLLAAMMLDVLVLRSAQALRHGWRLSVFAAVAVGWGWVAGLI